MKTNKFGEIVMDQEDLCDLAMRGRNVLTMRDVTVSQDLDIKDMIFHIEEPGTLLTWKFPADESQSVPEFDRIQQGNWAMPQEYRDLDIAQYVLDLCTTQEQLQRVGQELLMYQEHDLFDLLKYMKYLVDVMRENQVIWGVGRGSSVSSYVLYLLGVHRVDSMYHDLDPHEFLR